MTTIPSGISSLTAPPIALAGDSALGFRNALDI